LNDSAGQSNLDAASGRDAASDHEEQLAAILEQLVDDSRNGRQPGLEAVVREHPHMAREIRELWATAMMAEDFASFSGVLDAMAEDPSAIPGPASRLEASASGRLPRTVGDYELLEELGRGGMGVVFKARQRSLGRIVALKMILRGEMAGSADVARFRVEAEAAARLNHPHIVPVYEVGEQDGQPYFSMKLIEGTTLARRIAEGPLPSREAAEILRHVATAIAAAHQQGFLHRDLKPSNVLIDTEGRPYVTDFGLAKRVSTSTRDADEPEPSGVAGITQSGAILGTPGYMAPEQAAGRRGRISISSDVYSLGAILYAMLTGRPPFQAATPVDTVLMVLEQDPLPPRLLNQSADPDMEMIALKCLQKPVDLRYADAASLADDLEAYLEHRTISARSSRFTHVVSRAFRETHHAGILENWGLLWMWHSLVLLVLCVTTNIFQVQGVTARLPYVGLWGMGLGIWAAIFWELRRRAGPITFVERQVAHLWAGSMIASTLLYVVEAILGLQVLELSPVLAVVSGMVFLVKAGMLTGRFYVQSAALYLTAFVMAVLQRPGMPQVGITVFGVVSAVCFFVPGLKYYRQRAAQ
jgi:serine/threonine-protein kinase